MPLFSVISAKLGHFFVCNDGRTGRDLSVHDSDNNPDNN